MNEEGMKIQRSRGIHGIQKDSLGRTAMISMFSYNAERRYWFRFAFLLNLILITCTCTFTCRWFFPNRTRSPVILPQHFLYTLLFREFSSVEERVQFPCVVFLAPQPLPYDRCGSYYGNLWTAYTRIMWCHIIQAAPQTCAFNFNCTVMWNDIAYFSNLNVAIHIATIISFILFASYITWPNSSRGVREASFWLPYPVSHSNYGS